MGRTNFAKCIVPSDPPVIQAFKQLTTLRPMTIINKANPGDMVPLNNTVIVRRGRNTLTTVTKDYKESIDSAMNEFKSGFPSQPDSRTAILDKRKWE